MRLRPWRYVCREWYNIISSPEFIDAHLKNTERGLLISQDPSGLCYVEGMMKNTCNEEGYSDDNAEFGMSNSCNGLVMIITERNVIVNLITKEVVTLPRPGGMSCIAVSRMGYTRLSKKYKLVLFYTNYQDRDAVECGILTLGVDREWRSLFKVHGDTNCGNFGSRDFCNPNLIVTAEGILHVIHPKLPLVLNLDLETETFYTRATPKRSEEHRTTYMGNGRSLCFMDYRRKFVWELWLLKDAETGEWTKLVIIDLGPKKMLRDTFCPTGFVPVPVGFLKDEEIVVFYVHEMEYSEDYWHENSHPSSDCITYNVKTEGINSFHLDDGYTLEMDQSMRYIPFPHVKSLVSPKPVANLDEMKEGGSRV